VGSVAKLIMEFTNVMLLPGSFGGFKPAVLVPVSITQPELGLIVRTSWFWNQNWAILKT
jgi:hypothetical protein